jgi:AraC-like DNA-binding protein
MDLGRLAAAITRHAGTGLTSTALPGVSVFRASSTTDPVADMLVPAVALIAQGAKETSLNGRAFTYGPGQFLVASVELPVVGRITRASVEEPFLAAVLALRPARIAELLLDTATSPPDAPPTGIAVDTAAPELVDAVTRLLALLDTPSDAAALAAGVEREVLWRLVTGPQGAMVRQIGLADSRLTHLARTMQWIRHHYRETLRVSDLAAMATMSVSSFHRHFRTVTSMTPIQFQKQIRLHEARAHLLAARADVSGIGHAVGYDSPSQFTREYRRMFGVPPSQERHQ